MVQARTLNESCFPRIFSESTISYHEAWKLSLILLFAPSSSSSSSRVQFDSRSVDRTYKRFAPYSRFKRTSYKRVPVFPKSLQLRQFCKSGVVNHHHSAFPSATTHPIDPTPRTFLTHTSSILSLSSYRLSLRSINYAFRLFLSRRW